MTNAQAAVSPEAAAAGKQRTAHKRGHGEGNIEQRANGTWRARLMVGRKPDGKPDVRSITGKTRAEVQKKLAELSRRRDQGMLGDRATERETLAAFLDRWMAATAATIRDRTVGDYEIIVRRHIKPGLGKHKLTTLRPEHIQTWHAAMLAAGASPASVRKRHTVLHHALKDAMLWGYLARNVCDAVKVPRTAKQELRPPAAAELRTLLEVSGDDPLRALYAVAIYSGCRQGELLGLTWDDLDLDRGTLTVRRSLSEVHAGVPTFTEPKTPKSRRTVTLPAQAVAILREHRSRQLGERLKLGPDYAPYNLVFATSLGTALMKRNVLRSFKAALARAGLPQTVRFHDLRHAAATLLLQAGVHPKVVSERLGHSTITLTLDTYSHVAPGLDAEAAEKLARALGGA